MVGGGDGIGRYLVVDPTYNDFSLLPDPSGEK